MSKTERDQRGRPRSGKGHKCHGCSYCGAGEYKPFGRRRTRRQKRASIAEQLA